jgi:hypothetical protein
MSQRSVVGSVFALVALLAGIMGGVDSLSTIWNAGLAFILGYILGLVWQGITVVFTRKGGGSQIEAEGVQSDGESSSLTTLVPSAAQVS